MKQIGSIQILRALAALMVVLAHAQDDALHEATKAGLAFARTTLVPWVAGVDLFFVISGFIMVHASERLFAAPGGATTFLVRRLIRIVPLYWLATAIMLIVVAVLARHGQARLPGLAETLTSLGFVPYARPGDGAPRPVVPLGWTLNYEMFFYVVFAAFLFLRRDRAVTAIAATLCGLVAVGAWLHPESTALAFWSDPLVLEFALGMGLALAWHRGLRLPDLVAALVAAGAIAVLARDVAGMGNVPAFGVDPNGFARLFGCGVPMAALFAAVVLRHRSPHAAEASPARRFGILLGDASYALYLFHPMVIVLARKLYLAAGLGREVGVVPLVALEIVAAAAAAILIHLYLERPVTRALQQRFVARGCTAAARTIAPAVANR